MNVVFLLFGISLVTDLVILPCPTSATELKFIGSCFYPKEGETVVLEDPTFSVWAEKELNQLNKYRMDELKYNESDKVVHNPKMSQYAKWHADRKCENIKKYFGEHIPNNHRYEGQENYYYWYYVNNSIGFTLTECNNEMQHEFGKDKLGVVNLVSTVFGYYQGNLVNYAGLRTGSSMFLPIIEEIGFAENYCNNARVISVMTWPALFRSDFNPEDLTPKCIVDNDGKSVKINETKSSQMWRLRLLSRVNQLRKADGLSHLLLNNELCKSAQWALLQLKDKPDLKVKTTQELMDGTGNKDWKLQCGDALLDYNGKSDSNFDLDAIQFVDSIKANKTGQAYNNIFAESTREICVTYELINHPKEPGGDGVWKVGIMVLNHEEEKKSLNGGTTPVAEYVMEEIEIETEKEKENSGVVSHILKFCKISVGVIGLRLFFTFI